MTVFMPDAPGVPSWYHPEPPPEPARLVEPAPVDDPALAAARLYALADERAVQLIADYDAVLAALDEIGVR